MKLIVQPHKIYIDKQDLVNEKEINITKIQFEFVDIPENYVKEAYFTYDNNSYKVILENNECDIPNEVLQQKGDIEIGCVCYFVDGDNITRYNPSPVYVNTLIGSLKNATNTEPITPTDKEQMEQAIQDMEAKVDNLDIDAEKVDKTTTITITKKDGTQQTTEILDGNDGVGLNYNWQGTELGIKREDEGSYQYVDLKGDKGDAGAIKMEIVAQLPETGADDTIYLVPYEQAETGNIYKEYIYVNGNWEELGSIPIQVDLTDYVKKTDYATDSVGGVIKVASANGWGVNNNGVFYPFNIAYSNYQNAGNTYVISKGTLENVITGKGLVSNTDYATYSKGGVFKTLDGYSVVVDNGFLKSNTITYANYPSTSNHAFISKGTLENVITGKDLTTKAYVDGLVGDINTALDAINGESI